jgi:NNP family nitrate/nitrite transporter-like MFS transporter
MVARRGHTWLLSFLYIGTFGSFVGFSAALPLLLKTQFPETTTNLAFLGALIGSVARPLGGKLADRMGGARLTFVAFVVMSLVGLGLLWAIKTHSIVWFLGAFLLLFMATGIGNGSTFRMIPTIFREFHLQRASGPNAEAEALARAKRETAAVIGLSSAIGALGGYFVPRQFGASIKATGGPDLAVTYFIGFYLVCLAVTWFCYLRTRAPITAPAPALAKAEA